MKANNLIGLKFFLRDGHFMMVPSTLEVAKQILDGWSQGKFRDQPCDKCGGSGKRQNSGPGTGIISCPECHGDGKTLFFLRSSCPIGPIPEWCVRMDDVKMIHTQILDPMTLQVMAHELQQLAGAVQGVGTMTGGNPNGLSG